MNVYNNRGTLTWSLGAKDPLLMNRFSKKLRKARRLDNSSSFTILSLIVNISIPNFLLQCLWLISLWRSASALVICTASTWNINPLYSACPKQTCHLCAKKSCTRDLLESAEQNLLDRALADELAPLLPTIDNWEDNLVDLHPTKPASLWIGVDISLRLGHLITKYDFDFMSTMHSPRKKPPPLIELYNSHYLKEYLLREEFRKNIKNEGIFHLRGWGLP